MKHLLRPYVVGFVALAAAPIFALSGSGDSAPGDLDTVTPSPGVVQAPPTGTVGIPIWLGYSGAVDSSGITIVELWSRKDSESWALRESVLSGDISGSLSVFPTTTGVYYFDLVAQDSLGNRSTEPSGNLTIGSGVTVVSSDVADWSLLDL